MRKELDAFFHQKLHDNAAQATTSRKKNALLQCSKYPPILKSMGTTGMHFGKNGQVLAHRDAGDTGYGMVFWFKVRYGWGSHGWGRHGWGHEHWARQ